MSDTLLREIYTNGIFFLSDNSDYSYASVCLADGLRQLGVPIFSNIPYHEPRISDIVFTPSEPREPETIGMVVLDLTETSPLHNQIVRFTPPHPRTVVICMHDNAGEICFPDQPAFCTHESRLRTVAGPRIPIAFGVSSAMLGHARSLVKPGQIRKNAFLSSFRPSEGQTVRTSLELSFMPLLRTVFTVDTQVVGTERWSEEYYRHLAGYRGSVAYGGFYSQNLLKNPWFRTIEPLSSFLSVTTYHQETVVLRWDSWRFWESLALGCATLHLDFDHYGFDLPVLPENWTHYIGIRLDRLKEDMERLHDEQKRLPDIAEQGREWAIRHYSPDAVAQRFLETSQRLFSPSVNSCQACS